MGIALALFSALALFLNLSVRALTDKLLLVSDNKTDNYTCNTNRLASICLVLGSPAAASSQPVAREAGQEGEGGGGQDHQGQHQEDVQPTPLEEAHLGGGG